MAIRNYNVINANHDRVLAVIEKFLRDRYPDACRCPRCLCDITAIALNYLPPHYIVEGNGSEEHGSPWVMVETAVVEAIDRVMENPNHPKATSAAEQRYSGNPDVITS